jgi:aspartate/methionine/tyrosine aminotransferase
MKPLKKICITAATATAALMLALGATQSSGVSAVQADPNWDSAAQVRTLASAATGGVNTVEGDPNWASAPADVAASLPA